VSAPGDHRDRVRLWAGLLLAVVVSAVWGAFWWRGRPERHLAAAEAVLDSGDPERAVPWLELPERTPRTRDRALLLRVRSALARGRLEEAVNAIGRVKPGGPRDTDLAFWKGRALYAGKQSARAVAWFQEVVRRRPDDAEARRWLAAAAYDLGDRVTALTALHAVTRLQPDDPRAWRTLALLYKEDAAFEDARPAYQTTLKLDPGQPLVRLELAETLIALGDYRGAERQLSLCKGQVPEGERVSLLVQCRRILGDPEEVRSLLDAALSASPAHPRLLGERAQSDFARGRYREAVEQFDRALAAEPSNAKWLYQRGLALRKLGRAAESDRDLARASGLNRDLARLSQLDEEASRKPNDPEVRYQLGRLCVRLGKPEMAVSWFQAALACDPRHAAARAGLNSLRTR
jgi:Flp pilus assembly protein TadD